MSDDKIFNLADKAYDEGDFEKSFLLFEKIATNKNHNAMSRLACMCADGEGTDQNINKSILWDLKAIEHGSFISKLNLAITFRTIGNIQESKEWFKKAVKSGDGEAALQLAKLYMASNNKIVKKYLNIAIESMNLCDNSLVEAKYLLDLINSR